MKLDFLASIAKLLLTNFQKSKAISPHVQLPVRTQSSKLNSQAVDYMAVDFGAITQQSQELPLGLHGCLF
jgi:hypothetical protein